MLKMKEQGVERSKNKTDLKKKKKKKKKKEMGSKRE